MSNGIHSIQPDGTVVYMPDDSGKYPRMKPEVAENLKWKRYHNEVNFDRRRVEPIYVYEEELDTEGVWG